MSDVPTVALAGVSGYGRRHLQTLLRLHAAGRVALVGIADPSYPPEIDPLLQHAGAAPERAGDLTRLLGRSVPDTVVIATPPHTHHALASAALRAGASVYLEKPPVPLPEQLDDLDRLVGGRRLEVGFQQTRDVVDVVGATLEGHPVGRLRRVTAFGALRRPDSYYARAPWAGRHWLGDAPVFDGSLFNPLAHVLHAALVLARQEDPAWRAERIDTMLASVRDIEADDFAALRVSTSAGPTVTAIGTTAADRVIEPSIALVGEFGTVTVRHRDLRVRVNRAGREVEIHGVPGTPALERAVTDPHGVADPVADLAGVRPFVTVVAATVRLFPRPVRLRGRVDGGEDPQTCLPGIARAIRDAVRSGRLPGEHPEAGDPVGERPAADGDMNAPTYAARMRITSGAIE
ncbi:Gfo/Idh/MocA family protein [Myceligenerans pegani]|uniref:Gfo/Idh/MocA family oxidoreductase n=1 Tax=Myceligenerans pegani TaxID=2776917 RepID=A0ABR9MZX9_9MICO|nr:Gfo/Idh/MocA family oxidoreductase [Myceligenerans sp. TRM 65318]MBE1876581.1 Gfo/Idh/MocA family oxidoreductase [Myceligenerans sp. TRM 65318]MBE3018852.1 Gfo/Idh/MocA family oxidoreductase [Myceligenerans sp. TRM 65318]